ncbi:MAG: hypothetical protein MI784_16785 [Cytophagales bacterium]|nr:hypothetical protein [Cytophagales bacterium]
MSKKDRKTLKEHFQSGTIPTQESFENLIDSCVNIVDDDSFRETVRREPSSGWAFRLLPDKQRWASFFQSAEGQDGWSIDLEKSSGTVQADDSLVFKKNSGSPVWAAKENKVGINRLPVRHTLEVEGTVSFPARVGTFGSVDEVPADKKWHTVSPPLQGVRILEIAAQAGGMKKRKRIVVYGVAVSCFGWFRRRRIRLKRGRLRFWNCLKIRFRWKGTPDEYVLQVRTNRKLGDDERIRLHLTELWSEQLLDEEC